MRKLASVALLLFLGATVSFAANRTFVGDIMDSPCAAMGGHAAGYKMTGTNTPKACTLACVKDGGKFVLYNPDTKTTYKLDNQTEPRAFAGEIVRVTGSYNPSTKTIHVVKIEAFR
ncbi:MAG: DUF5818 domain-containing protein [Candidatus Acidiferrales bacterium]